jgi:phosphoribosylglycinamide formyltransferase-1
VPKHRLAILLSGRGSNFEAICRAIEDGRIPDTQITAVISDVADAPGLALAAARGLPAFPLERRQFPNRRAHEEGIARVLEAAGVDLICLAGYMRLLSPEFVSRYRGRIVNIHPSLLPKYPGLHAQRQALEAGDSKSGCTVHLVDEGTDTGPVILQKEVPILPGDTEESLSSRILEQEHRIYPEAIARILAGEGKKR